MMILTDEQWKVAKQALFYMASEVFPGPILCLWLKGLPALQPTKIVDGRTPRVIRGARAMLHLSQAEFAKLAGVAKTNLNHIENGSDPRRSTLEKIQAAFEAAGIEFLERNGVRLRQ